MLNYSFHIDFSSLLLFYIFRDTRVSREKKWGEEREREIMKSNDAERQLHMDTQPCILIQYKKEKEKSK